MNQNLKEIRYTGW